MNRIGFIASTVLLLLALLSSMVFVVDQRQFGVVYALGQIKEVITEPGLNFKLPPPFQNVRYIDKRLLTLDSSDTESMLTAEKQRVVIDWYVRWRITDPSEYIRNVGLDENAGALQLNRVVRNAFQEEVNRRTVKELLSLKRDALMSDVKREVLEAVRGSKPWGVDVVDVRITRVDYVEAITESVYRRMEAERKRVANELRSTGAAEGRRFAQTQTGSARSPLPMPTATPRRSRARVMRKLRVCMRRHSAVILNLHSSTGASKLTRRASTARAMSWCWIRRTLNFSRYSEAGRAMHLQAPVADERLMAVIGLHERVLDRVGLGAGHRRAAALRVTWCLAPHVHAAFAIA